MTTALRHDTATQDRELIRELAAKGPGNLGSGDDYTYTILAYVAWVWMYLDETGTLRSRDYRLTDTLGAIVKQFFPEAERGRRSGITSKLGSGVLGLGLTKSVNTDGEWKTTLLTDNRDMVDLALEVKQELMGAPAAVAKDVSIPGQRQTLEQITETSAQADRDLVAYVVDLAMDHLQGDPRLLAAAGYQLLAEASIL